jgi:pimeloyl-ACP methyl ester carboxylesterase
VKLYTYTGGKAFNPLQPTVLMIHGVLNDHSVWILQSRYLAHHGWNVLAIDLPGHAKSEGQAPASVEAAADAVIAYLQALGIRKIALIGHSFGSLIALEATSRLASSPIQVTHLCLVGTAYPMKVSQVLLDASRDEPKKAIAMVNTFSHSTLSPPPSSLGPGTWLYGSSAALMKRVLATSSKVDGSNVFHTGFTACNDYTNGAAAVAQVVKSKTKIQFILAKQDQMTQLKAAQSLIQLAPEARVDVVNAGHQMMSEAPDVVLDALKDFLKT